MTGTRKGNDWDHRQRQVDAIEEREYAERVARDLEHRTGEESPAIKLLREWKAGHPDREWAICEDFSEKRGITVSFRSGDTQHAILIPWPSPWLSREAAHRATAKAVSEVIDAMSKGAHFPLTEIEAVIVKTPPEPRENEG